MTLKEIRDAFIVRQKIESMKRGVPFLDLGTKTIAYFISMAQQDIQKELDVVIGSQSITLIAGTDTYDCPANFGKLKWAMYSDYQLDIVSDYELTNQVALNGSVIKIAQYINGNTPRLKLYPTPSTSGDTVTIYYSVDLNYYQPSGGTDQIWGDFDGSTFTGKLILPDKYIEAVILFMLSQIFDDKRQLYKEELLSLKGNQAAGMPLRLNYEFGKPVVKNYVITGSTGNSVMIGDIDVPVKRFRLRASDDGSYTVELSSGWTTTPTVAINVIADPNTFVITSASSEFTTYRHVEISNGNFGYSVTGESIITITPDPSTGWGDVEIIIDIY